MSAVLIRGAGVAACCCTRLLGNAGIRVVAEPAERPKLPAIMLSDRGQKLLADVFYRHDLFTALPVIRRRFVAWGPDANVLAIPHSAVVVSEQMLLERIRPHLASGDVHQGGNPDWTVFTSRPIPASSTEQHFGSRMANASEVRLKDDGTADACWIESVEDGWLFLLPGGEGRGWLLSVGAPADSLLKVSRLIASQIEAVVAGSREFPSHPRAIDPLCGSGWLACGNAALGFDPLCGDGVGYSIREAILASALIRHAMEGGDVDSLLEHYSARLLAGLKKHLEVCRTFYASGHTGLWWAEQQASVERGVEWCASHLASVTEFRYRLNGFSLEPVR